MVRYGAISMNAIGEVPWGHRPVIHTNGKWLGVQNNLQMVFKNCVPVSQLLELIGG